MLRWFVKDCSHGTYRSHGSSTDLFAFSNYWFCMFERLTRFLLVQISWVLPVSVTLLMMQVSDWWQWIRWKKLPCESKNSNYFTFSPFSWNHLLFSAQCSGFSQNRLFIIYDFTSVAEINEKVKCFETWGIYFKTKFEDTVILLTNPKIVNSIE